MGSRSSHGWPEDLDPAMVSNYPQSGFIMPMAQCHESTNWVGSKLELKSLGCNCEVFSRHWDHLFLCLWPNLCAGPVMFAAVCKENFRKFAHSEVDGSALGGWGSTVRGQWIVHWIGWGKILAGNHGFFPWNMGLVEAFRVTIFP